MPIFDRRTLIALAGGAMLLAAACGGSGGSGATDDAPAPAGEATIAALPEDQARLAAGIYEAQACAICHGDQAEGGENGPALIRQASYWTVDRLALYLEDPTAFREANPDFEDRRETEYDMEMPGYEHVPADERRLLAHWLLTR